MRPRRSWVWIGVVLAWTCVAGVASSSSGGITGKSGKQGGSCNGCHQGGSAPMVKLDGPTSIDAGTVAVYMFRIETDASLTGMNAATSDGVMEGDAGGGTLERQNEIVHASTTRPDSGAVVYAFSMTAPQFGGKITLFAAGNACNGDGDTSGDQSATDAIEIAVNGPARPPLPEAGPPAKPAEDASPPVVNGDAGKTRAAPEPEDDSGCAIGWLGADRSSLPTGAVFAALLALAVLARPRRR